MGQIGVSQLELFIRGGSLALIAMWVTILLINHRGGLAGRTAAFMLVFIGSHVVVTSDVLFPVHGLARLPFAVAASLVPTSFWLFARCWFNDDARIDAPAWTLAGLGVLPISSSIYLDASGAGSPLWLQAAVRVIMGAFALAGLWEAWRGRSDDLVEPRRKFRLVLIGTVGVFAILINGIEILSGLGEFSPPLARLAVEAAILLLCLGFAAFALDFRTERLFAASGAVPKDEDGGFDANMADRILHHMEREKAWRDEELSVAKLAAQLGLQEYKLRRLINRGLGHRNFAAFLNRYRIEEVCAALDDPSQATVPISTIALDAGFGSLGPFNRAFREAKGVTPSVHRTLRLADSEIG